MLANAELNRLTVLIIKESFGCNVGEVASALCSKGRCSLTRLCSLTNMGIKKVKEALIILLHHSLVTFVEVEEKMKAIIYYEIHPLLVLQRNQFPIILKIAHDEFGLVGQNIIYKLLLNGRLTFANLDLEDDQLESCFLQMLKKRFIIKCDAKDCATTKDQLMAEEASMIEQQGSVITPTALTNLKKKLKEKRMAEQSAAENLGQDEELNFKESSSFFRVNLEQFHMFSRDKEFVMLAEKKINSVAGHILECILNECRTSDQPNGLTLVKISTLINSEIPLLVEGSSNSKLDDYLMSLSSNEARFLVKVDQKGGGLYKVNYEVAARSLKLNIIESIIQEKWGLLGCRIWRILQQKKKLDEKQVSKLGMISQKDGRECLYKMMKDGFCFLQDVPKTADHSASRTYFLWYIDPDRTIKLIIKNSHKTIFNLKSRLKKEMETRKILLDKMKRLDVVSGQAKLTETDKKELEVLEKIETIIRISELRLESTIMILRDI